MEIIVKGRHAAVSDRFRDHATAKLARIERLDNKLIRVDVEVSELPNHRQSGHRERVELTVYSRGPVIRAEASADDRFAALDISLAKLEERLRRLSGRRKAHHGKSLPFSLADLGVGLPAEVAEKAAAQVASPEQAPVAAAAQPAAQKDRGEDGESIVPIEMDGDGPLVVREKFHKAEPMTIDQALFEMELVGHDFFLFRDKEGGLPSVVYRRRGYNYGVLRLVEG
ncbi:ribosome hibernation-promoting factor, HPF/YfiA family [Sphaerimonospora sp. CA-214678]|uniref:ribosome hibernation-promoting factor, HPF/YfiA family n=1 Tax=Sphaerimonospora sp. CA-214678 TaxID=3240029 RepID=UPI003D8A974F